jgi:hypothetical protein
MGKDAELSDFVAKNLENFSKLKIDFLRVEF